MDNSQPFLSTTPEDFTRFFLNEDSLRSLDWELALTLNRRYKCAAGCKMCYLGDKWMSHEEFKPFGEYTEKNLTKEWEGAFFDFADNFQVLSTIDDMRYLKKNFDTQYDFYKRNCERFLLSSISDQSLFYHMPIIMNEMKFKDIYELSFSDAFLVHNYKKLKSMIKRVLKRYNIKHIKVIRNTIDQSKISDRLIKEFYEFLHDNGINTFNHHNVLGDYKKVDDAAHAVYSEGFGPFSLLNQVIFLAFDDLYMELKNFTPEENKFKIASLWDVAYSFDRMIPSLLRAKLETYNFNSKTLKNKDSHFVKYFEHCAKTFKVNPDFNFIPYPLIRNYAKWPQALLDSGEWEDLGPGYIRKGERTPISVIEVKK